MDRAVQGNVARNLGCLAGIVAAVIGAVVTFWTVAFYLPGQEVAVPRILWVVLSGIYALPGPLELIALALFSLVIGLGLGGIVVSGVARVAPARR